jgi:hypothetical protein
LPVPKSGGTIPEEWINGWWLNKLERDLLGEAFVDMVPLEEDEGDFYG